MKLKAIFAAVGSVICVCGANSETSSTKTPLSYASEPAGLYAPSKENITTLLDLFKTHPELSALFEALSEPAGM